MPKYKLQYGAIAEVARWTKVHRVTISAVVNGHANWRLCSPGLIRALHAVGWVPDEPQGRAKLRAWIASQPTPLRDEP